MVKVETVLQDGQTRLLSCLGLNSLKRHTLHDCYTNVVNEMICVKHEKHS